MQVLVVLANQPGRGVTDELVSKAVLEETSYLAVQWRFSAEILPSNTCRHFT